MRIRQFQLLCLLFLIPSIVFGKDYKMSNITTKDGLFGDRIFKSFRDKDGYLWILGIGGVARYDGHYITNYTSNTNKAEQYISGDRLYSICQDGNGTIWIGGNGGLNRFDPKLDTFIPIQIKGIKDIRFIVNHSNDSIWVSGLNSSNCLVNIENNELSLRAEKFMFSASAFDADGNLWVSTANGRIYMNFQPTKFKCNSRINDICFTTSGSLYLATNNGLTVIRDFLKKYQSGREQNKSRNAEFWLPGRIVHSAAYYEGCVWAGTDNGLNRCILNSQDLPSNIQDYYSVASNPYSITNNLIQDIFCDREEILWISTYGGVNMIDPSKRWFNSFRFDPEENNTLHDNYIFCINGNKQGSIWMGSYTSGFSLYNSATKVFRSYNRSNSILGNNLINQIYCDQEGNTWITTPDEVYIQKGDVIERIEIVGLDKKQTVKSIIQKEDGTYWMGTHSMVLKIQRNKDGQYEIVREIELKNAKHILCLFIDAAKRFWVGSTNGLFLLTKEKMLTKYRKKGHPELKSNLIQTIASDSKGNMWFGSDKGLYSLQNDSTLKNKPQAVKFNAYFTEDGLSSNYISGLLPGKNGQLWLSSWKGMMKYEPKGKGVGKFTHYSFNDGIVSEKFNRYGNYLDTISNIAYFGSANGVNYFKLDERYKAIGESKVLIHEIILDGNSVSLDRSADSISTNIIATGKLNQLQIQLGSSSLLSPSKQLYAWRLNGRDELWHYTRNRELILEDIPTGEYQLQIGVVSGDNTLTPSYTINIIVESNLYSYLILALFIVIGLAGTFYIYKLRKPKKNTTKYEYSKLSSDKSSEIVAQLNELMEEKKPYLNPELTVVELASLLGISSTKLSQVLNDFLQTRFYEYINKYRVEEFLECIEKGENEKMTLIALSEKCGFSSKSSFYRFFKEAKGTTPAQYVKSRKK